MDAEFKDYFSRQSESYARFRPDYPQELFSYISALASEHELAWDCATGNGQAAISIAHHFKKVIATDASKKQIEFAVARDNIEYRVANAEASGLESHSVDLITVAQAIHWFNFDKFYAEARRVLKDSGVIAVWAYGLSRVTPHIDETIQILYRDTLEDFWPEERKYVDEEYRTIPFPFEEIKMDNFIIRKNWSLQQFIGYLNSWSAVHRYIAQKGINPVDDIVRRLSPYWVQPMPVVWPVYLRVGIHTD